MGTYYRLYGRIVIEPPAPVPDLPETPERPAVRYDTESCGIVIRPEIAGHPTKCVAAYLVVTGIVPFTTAETKIWDLEGDLRRLLDALPADCAARGAIVTAEECHGPVDRFIVEGRAIREERARLVWPDGSPVTELNQ